MALVGYHQMPKLLVVKEYPKAAYRQLARKVSPRLIYHLERADMIGRHEANNLRSKTRHNGAYTIDTQEFERLAGGGEPGSGGIYDSLGYGLKGVNEIGYENEEVKKFLDAFDRSKYMLLNLPKVDSGTIEQFLKRHQEMLDLFQEGKI